MNDINNALKKELEEMQKELDKQTPELKKILDEETKRNSGSIQKQGHTK